MMIQKISRSYFISNPDIVDSGTIPKALKYLLKKGKFKEGNQSVKNRENIVRMVVI